MTENMVVDASVRLDKKALLARSEALHEIAAHHVNALGAFLSPVRARGYARQLAALRADVWSESKIRAAFVIELAAWTGQKGRSTALERYARQQTLPSASDEAAVLVGIQTSIISVWTVQEAHPVAGWIVRDIANDGTVWIVDDGLDQYFKVNGSPCFLTRLFKSEQDGYWMICGNVYGVSDALATFVLGNERLEGICQSGSEEHAVISREAGYVLILYAIVPPAADDFEL